MTVSNKKTKIKDKNNNKSNRIKERGDDNRDNTRYIDHLSNIRWRWEQNDKSRGRG